MCLHFSSETVATHDAGWLALATADIDADGLADVVVVSADTVARLVANAGVGAGWTASDIAAPGLAAADAALLADVDGDGDTDILLGSSAQGQVSVQLNDGAGHFGAAQVTHVDAGARLAAATDLDGDGHVDLVLEPVDGGLLALNGQSDGIFGAAHRVTTQASTSSANPLLAMKLADLRGIGRRDVVMADAVGGLVIHLNDGQGNFSTAATLSSGSSDPLRSVVVADLNGDGHADIAATGFNGTNVFIWRGNGDGSFLAPTSYSTGTRQTVLAVGDLDVDGKRDLVAIGIDAGLSGALLTNILRGDGQGGLSAPITIASRAAPATASDQPLSVVDINGDGVPDIVHARVTASGTVVEVLLNERPDVVISQLLAPTQAVSGQAVQVSWTLTNQGADIARGPWTDTVYLATDAAGGGLQALGSFSFDGSLAAGTSVTRVQTLTLPQYIGGARWFVVTTTAPEPTQPTVLTGHNSLVASVSTAVSLPPDLEISGAGVGKTGTYYTLMLDALTEPHGGAAQAIRINWGDGRSTLVNRAPSTPYFPESVKTVYSKAGRYTISVDILESGTTFSSVDTLSIDVQRDRTNTAPVLKDDSISVLSNSPRMGSVFADNGAGRDLDPEGDAFTVLALNGDQNAVGNSTLLASGAMLTLSADGSFRYDPNGQFGPGQGERATDSFTYSVIDSLGATATATVRLDIRPPGDAPDLIAQNIQFAGGSAYTIANLSYTLTNAGKASISKAFVERVYLSRDTTLSADDLLIRELSSGVTIDGGESIGRSFNVRLPRALGDYYTLVSIDPTNAIVESNESNLFVSNAGSSVIAAYTATLATSVQSGPATEPITLSGSALLSDGVVKAPFAVVEIVILGGGTSREIYAITDAQGNYSIPFALSPGGGAGGTYQFFARYPGALTDTPNAVANVAFYGVDLIGPTTGISVVAGTFLERTLTVKNPSNLDLTGLTVRLSGLDAGETGTVSLATTSLAAFGETQVTLSLSAPANATGGDDAFQIILETAEGAVDVADALVRIVPLRANLVFDTARLQDAMVRGASELVTVKLTNSGGAASGPLTVSLPPAPFLSLASPTNLPALAPGASTEISLLLRPATDLLLAEYEGAFNVSDANGSSASLPFTFTALSSATGDLVVNLQDEFTFFAQGNPLVQNATVIVTNAVTHEVFYQSTDVDGTLRLSSIPEGFYSIEVQAPDHDRFGATVEIKAGANPAVNAFMSLQTVRTTWSVEQVELEDRYNISVTSDFITNVPVPVVVVDPGDIDISGLDQVGESQTFTLKVTNHGLIAAKDFKLSIQDHPLYRIDIPFSSIPIIDADSSISFDVKFTRIAALPSATNTLVDEAAAVSPGGGTGDGVLTRSSNLADGNTTEVASATALPSSIACFIGAVAEYAYECGGSFIQKRAQLVINGVEGNCKVTEGGGGVYHAADDLSGFFAFYAGFSAFANAWSSALAPLISGPGLPSLPGAVPGSYFSVVPIEPKFEGCNVIKNLAPCAKLNKVVYVVYLAADLIMSNITDVQQNYNADAPQNSNTDTHLKLVEKTIDAARKASGAGEPNFAIILKQIKQIINIAECVNGLADFLGVPRYKITYVGPQGAGSAASQINHELINAPVLAEQNITSFGPTSHEPDIAAAQAIEGARILDQFIYYYFGEILWTELHNNTDQTIEFIADVFSFSSKNIGVEIPTEFLNALFQRYGSGIPSDVIAEFVARWNRTIAYNAIGIESVSQVPLGESTDFIAIDRLRSAAEAVVDLSQTATDQGYSDVSDLLNEIIGIAEGPYVIQNGGVCAEVKLQIDQGAVLTRQAFKATLQIVDMLPTDLTDIKFEIEARDANGEQVAVGTFAILPPNLDGVTGIDGTGKIQGGSTGTVTFTVIPTREAAADENTVYTLGGRLSYRSGDNILEVPVISTPIIVVPQPELELDYFFQRDVFSDNPFTPAIEPSEPFTLGLIVTNVGSGTARNLTIESAQPKIIDNEKGLLAEFNIVGTVVDGHPFAPTLKVSFGNIAPHDSETATFLMTSSLQGHFEGYDASFQHLDAVGNLDLSLITQTRIHELIRSGDFDGDGRLDFLTNDVPDAADRPDTLFLSDRTERNVAASNASILSSTSVDGTLTVLIATPDRTGNWQYFDLTTPTSGHYRLNSVTRDDGSTVQGEGAWLTNRSFHNGQTQATIEDRLHILDQSASITYTVTFSVIPPIPVTAALESDTGVSPIDNVTAIAKLVGSGAPGALVSFVEGGALLGTVIAGTDGRWSFSPIISDGLHSISVTESDAFGNSGSALISFVLDTIAPSAPTLVSITPDTGTSANDFVTSNGSLTLSGLAEAGSVVALFDGATAIGSATAAGSGKWSISLASALAAGNHMLRSSATDAAGNVSAPSATTLVRVQPPPTLAQATIALGLAEGQTLGNLAALLVANGQDLGTLSLSAVSTTGTKGFVAFNGGLQTLSYQASGYNAVQPTDSFSYTLTDDQGFSVTGSVAITVTGAALPTTVATVAGSTTTATAGGQRLISQASGQTLVGNSAGGVQFFGGADTRVTASGSGNSIFLLPGNHNVAMGANGNKLSSGDGNNTISGTGTGNSIIGGNGNNIVTGLTGSATITLGNGNNTITISGANNTITLGTGTDKVTISGTGGGNKITVGDGPNTITLGGAGNVIVAGNGKNTITNSGAGAAITTGSGDDSIQGIVGTAAIRAGLGLNSIKFSGSGSIVYNQGGTDTITDSGSKNSFVLATAGNGMSIFNSAALNNGDVFDLRNTLTAAGWDHNAASLSNFLTVGLQGSNTLVQIMPGGSGAGVTIASFTGGGAMSFNTFLTRTITI